TGPHPGAAAAAAAERQGAARPGDRLPEVPPEGARQALRQRPGAGRRPGAVPARRAGAGPAGRQCGAAGGRGPAGGGRGPGAVWGLLVALLVLALGGSGLLAALWLRAEEFRTAEAKAQAQQAEERERLSREKLEEVEDTVARNLMRPVGYDKDRLSEAELVAF